MKTQEKSGNNLVIFEERVNYDKGDYLFLVRKPNISEDELAKLKKAKGSKTCPLNEWNPVVLRGWVNFDELLKLDAQNFV